MSKENIFIKYSMGFIFYCYLFVIFYVFIYFILFLFGGGGHICNKLQYFFKFKVIFSSVCSFLPVLPIVL